MKAFPRGIKDFKTGQVTNPFNEGTSRAKDWERGFNKAYFENLARVVKNERRRRNKSKNT